MTGGRIVFVVTTARLPAGLLTAQAWDLIRAHPVLTATPGPRLDPLTAAGARVRVVAEGEAVDDLLAAAAEHDTVVWLTGPADGPDLMGEVERRLAEAPGSGAVESVPGSWDPVGAKLLDVVTVMDRLVGPDGDPWKRQQTHHSLRHFLLEEAYEAYDAIEAGDLEALREEMGDVLLQVVLHARMAQDAEHPWNIDDLAGLLAEKLIRRNPHVFGDEQTTDVDEIIENWERIKREEKARGSIMDGIALSQPALALAEKIVSRVRRSGLPVPLPPPMVEATDELMLGVYLLGMVADAQAKGLDAEAALRALALRTARGIRMMETPPD